MLKLEVINYKGVAPARAIAVEFDKVGGTIGRGDANSLVLPDAERIISRMHARISFRSGQYFIEDHGSSTPVIVNGHSLGRGVDAPLADGAEIKIGDYRLRAAVPESRAPAPLADTHTMMAAPSNVKDDPLALFGGGGAVSKDPFADLTPAKPQAPAQHPVAQPTAIPDPFAAPAHASNAAIPADFDPFANLGAPSTPAANKPFLPDESAIGISAASGAPSLNTMFGLNNTPPAKDPLAISQPIANPTGAGGLGGAVSLDPLAAFETTPPVSTAATQRNDVPELYGSFVPPRAVPDPALSKAATPPLQPVTRAAPVPTPPGDEHDAMLETQRFTREDVAKAAPVRAFLDGAGIADLDLPAGLTPETMHMLGQVLRETVQAMLDLLVARAMLKRELRADVTMMAARENNPLKFSPNVEAALTHLLAPQRGFMLPLEAVQDACNDLRSHQFAFMAGMRAALAGILQRFDPAQIEQRIKTKSMLDSLLPANRKAKMWDQFGELYGDMAKEAEDDFHTLFGREFVRAYEAQIRKLAQGGAESKAR